MAVRSTFFGLEIARTGLTVSQQGLNLTGHNISNVDTPGYTRQRIVNTAYDPYSTITQFRPVSSALVGSGTKVIVLDQIRDKFLDRQFRTEQTLASYWETRTQGLTYVESLLEDTSDGSLTQSIAAFISALNTGTTEATDREQRINLQRAASNLCQNFNLVYDRMIELQKSQNTAVGALVDQVNTIANNIAELNKSIVSYELSGQPANDLRDKRNLLLDELSSIADVEYSIDTNNHMTVKIGGEVLVNHTTVNELATRAKPNELAGEDDVLEPYWTTGSASGKSLLEDSAGDPIRVGGELQAHIDLRDGNGESPNPQGIPYYVNQLNTLARALAQIVNGVHSTGWSYPTDGGDSVTGLNFFHVTGSDYDSITAGNIKLSADVDDPGDIFNIAFSNQEIIMDETHPRYNDPDVTHSANQLKLKEIFALFNESKLSYTGNDNGVDPPEKTSIGGFESFFDGIVLDIAMTLKHSKDMSDTKNTLLASVDSQRTSVSGVSLDEEMTNMIKYQHAYNAASRMITTMDEALDKIINAMGRVGL